MKSIIGTTLVVAMALAGSLQTASAGPISFQFEGTVTSVDAPLALAFAPGDMLDLSYTFESTTPETPSGLYDAIISLMLSVGGYSATATSGTILVDGDNFSEDVYSASTDVASGGLAGADVGAFSLSAFRVGFVDYDLTAFADDSLPTSLDLTDFTDGPFDQTSFLLSFVNSITGETANVSGEITAVGIPAPGTLLLVLVGLVSLINVNREFSRCVSV